MHPNDVWLAAVEAMDAFAVHYSPAVEAALAAGGIGSPQGYLLLPALTFDPEPVTAALLRVRGQYTAPGVFDARLAELAEWGALTVVGEGRYRLTERGWQAAMHILDAADDALIMLAPMPLPEQERLLALLRRLVEACIIAPAPPGKWGVLSTGRRLAIYRDSSVLVQIEQYLSDLGGFRDDAHLAAWQPHEVSGEAWDALTAIWREGPAAPGEVHERLLRRGHPFEAYARALDALAVQGWLDAPDDDVYRLTGQGLQVRQDAEELTDRYFYAPWVCLDPGELVELRELLGTLVQGLEQLGV